MLLNIQFLRVKVHKPNKIQNIKTLITVEYDWNSPKRTSYKRVSEKHLLA